MTYQRNDVPAPIPGEPGQDQPLPAPGVWISLADRLPPYDDSLRVLVHTGGSSFAGEDFFDVPAIDLYAVGDDLNEIAEHATHWSVKPRPDAQHADDVAVDHFAVMMKAKLAKSRLKGRAGWQACSGPMLSAMLREHVEKGDPLDVAIFSMMLTLIGSETPSAEAANDPIAAEEPMPTADDLAALTRLPVRDMRRPGCGCEACVPQGNPFDDTAGNIRMILCATCGNKRCPHATDHRLACTGSNEPGQPGSSYADAKPMGASRGAE